MKVGYLRVLCCGLLLVNAGGSGAAADEVTTAGAARMDITPD